MHNFIVKFNSMRKGVYANNNSPKIFIASSQDGVDIARIVRDNLYKYSQAQVKNSSVEFEIKVWDECFQSGDITIEKLTNLAEEVDFAIFIFHPSDKVSIGEIKEVRVVRDNVILEYGLFLGHLTLNRCFVLVPDVDIKLPSDILGVNHMKYKNANINHADESSLSVLAHQIFKRIKEEGRSNRFKLPRIDIETIFTKTGLKKAYQLRREATEDMIKDISEAQKSLKLYARVYVQELVTFPRFVNALDKALSNCQDRFILRCVFTNRENNGLVEILHKIEDFCENTEDYRKHLAKGERECDKQVDLLVNQNIDKKYKRDFVYQKASINHILPYSFVIIDDKIIYVSIYNLSQNKYGTYAPTMKLECNNYDNNWANHYIEQLIGLDKNSTSTDFLVKELEEKTYHV